MGTHLRAMIEAQPAALRAVSDLDVAGAAQTIWRGRRVTLGGHRTSFHAAELGAYLFLTGVLYVVAVPSVAAVLLAS